MLKVTFDSNVWRIVSSPEIFPNEPSIEVFKKINGEITVGEISPFLAETTFTLEAIRKADRKSALSSYSPVVSCSEKVLPDGTIKLSLSIGPDKSTHPRNNQCLSSHLQYALDLGFKILRCPRISGFKNPDLQEDWFVGQTDAEAHERQELFGSVLRDIESKGCGIFEIKSIGEKYAPNPGKWLDGIRSAPDSESPLVAKAFAEWADGDSVSAHIAYRNDYFCTRDVGKSAGTQSILSQANRSWLREKYGVNFVTPEELATMLA